MMNPSKLLSYTTKFQDEAWNKYIQGCGIDHEHSTEFSSMCSVWDEILTKHALARYWVFRSTQLLGVWAVTKVERCLPDGWYARD